MAGEVKRGKGGSLYVLDISINKAAISSRCDPSFQNAKIFGGNRAVRAVVSATLYVRCSSNIKDVDLAVHRGGNRLAMTSS